MGRKPRFNLVGIPQHVIQRGHNRQPCFFSKNDYLFYLESLRLSASKFHCSIHAYVLMQNHVHLLVTPNETDAIPQLMQSLGRRYVRYVNKMHQRSGTLWEGRYRACLVDSDNYLFTCMRYIEMNPVRAGIVSEPKVYRWSSYRANANARNEEIITPHTLYSSLGSSAIKRAATYVSFFDDKNDSSALDSIRDALNSELILGSNSFKRYIEAQTTRPIRLGNAGRPRLKEERGTYWVANDNFSPILNVAC